MKVPVSLVNELVQAWARDKAAGDDAVVAEVISELPLAALTAIAAAFEARLNSDRPPSLERRRSSSF